MIEVLYFVFDPENDSDVSVAESASSLGAQRFPVDGVRFSILSTAEAGVDGAFVRRHFGEFADRVRIVPVDSDDYSQNKLKGLSESTADIVAFADSDCIYRPDWLSRIEGRLGKATGRIVGLAGPPRFKRGSVFRTTLLLADFGYLWEDTRTYAHHVNLHNFAIVRGRLDEMGESETPYHRFGAPSWLTRRLRQDGLRIELDREHVAIHGVNWRLWLGEKRMRRFAHAARMQETDRLAGNIAHGARSTKPLSWTPLWWRWARRYQRRVALCAGPLKFKRRTRILQRVLLAALSAWELVLIVFLAVFRPALHRMARRHDWW